MDELVLSGKKYISSKRASEITGYAKDYVGQLVRGGKIPATRVGRAWYVEEDALRSYEKNGKALTAPEAGLLVSQESSPVELKLTPRSLPRLIQKKGKTFSTVSHALLKNHINFPRTWSTVRYTKEEGEPLPIASKKASQAVSGIRIHRHQISPSRDLRNIRIKILKDKLDESPRTLLETPRKPILVKPVPHKDIPDIPAVENKESKVSHPTSRPFSYHPGYAFGALAVSCLVFAFLASGIFISSHVEIAPRTGAYAANAIFGYEYAKEALFNAPFIQSGFAALKDFFSFIVGSFGVLILDSLRFLKGIFNLVWTR